MGVRQSHTRKLHPRFKPLVDKLEDRTTPATLYVDPAFALPAPPADGTLVTFNVGYHGTVADLKYASSVAAWQADNTRVAFSNFIDAFDVAELNPGADEIRIARSTTPIPVDYSVADPVTGALNISQNLTLIGSGEGATVLTPTVDSLDELSSVFRVAGNSVGLIVQDLTFDGIGKNLGAGFLVRDGAAGTFRNVTVRNVAFNTAGVLNEGFGIIGFAGSILDVIDSHVEGYGRVGIQYADSTGSVFGTHVTGRGAGDFINNGIEVYGKSTVTITGSTITASSGRVGTDYSTGVLVFEDSGNAPNVTLIGNMISGNAVGLTVGQAADDPSVMRAEFNNIINNDVGADATNSKQGILAQNNWWGHPTGPFQATTNPTGLGNLVTDKVTFLPFLGTKTPVVSALTTDLYRTLTSTTGVAISPTPGQPNPVVSGPVSFTVTLALPVTGFDATDVVVTAPTGSTPAVTVTGTGANYTVTVGGLAGVGQVTALVNAQAAVANDGTLNSASGTASINFGVPPANTPPTITDVTNQSLTTGGTTGALAFTVGDAETPVGSLVVTGSSSDNSLIQSVVIGGSGAARTVTVTGAPGKTGTATITLTVADAQNANAIDTFLVTITDPTVPPVPPPPVRLLAVGADAGGGPRVSVYNSDGTLRFNFFAYAPDFTGGVRVATGDVNGDGTDDIIVGAGNGGGPHIRVIDGKTQADLGSFFAYENTLRNGTYVAAADVDGDGKAEIITGAGVGGGPAIAVFRGVGNEILRFFAFENTARGGVFVGGGDLDGDGKAEIIAGAGVGGGPVVATFNGTTGVERGRFFAYDSSSRNGVYVAAGNLSVIGPTTPISTGTTAEIVTGPGIGDATVKVFDGRNNAELEQFVAYSGVTTGVRVAVNDLNGDGVPDIVTGPGKGGGPNIKGFAPFLANPDVASFFAFEPTFTDGVYVG